MLRKASPFGWKFRFNIAAGSAAALCRFGVCFASGALFPGFGNEESRKVGKDCGQKKLQ